MIGLPRTERLIRRYASMRSGVGIRVGAGEPMSPAFVELMFKSIRRLADARSDAADDPRARVTAAEQYVTECHALQEMVVARQRAGADINRLQLDEVTYQVADAEYLH